MCLLSLPVFPQHIVTVWMRMATASLAAYKLVPGSQVLVTMLIKGTWRSIRN